MLEDFLGDYTDTDFYDDKNGDDIKRARLEIECDKYFDFDSNASTSVDSSSDVFLVAKEDIVDALSGKSRKVDVVLIDGSQKSTVFKNNFVCIHVRCSDGVVRRTSFACCKDCKCVLTNCPGGHMNRHKRNCLKGHENQGEVNISQRAHSSAVHVDSNSRDGTTSSDFNLTGLREIAMAASLQTVENGRSLVPEEVEVLCADFVARKREETKNKIDGSKDNKNDQEKKPNNEINIRSSYVNLAIGETFNTTISYIDEQPDLQGKKCWNIEVKFLCKLEAVKNRPSEMYGIIRNKAKHLGVDRIDECILSTNSGKLRKWGAERRLGLCPSAAYIFNSITARLHEPYSKFDYTQDELSNLGGIPMIIQAAMNIQRRSGMRIPENQEPCASFANLTCLRNLSTSMPTQNTIETARDSNVLNENWELVLALGQLQNTIKPFVEKYENQSMFLNMVIMDLFLLRSQFQELTVTGTKTLCLLARVSDDAVKYHIDNSLSNYHLAAVRLSPYSKRMQRIVEFVPEATRLADQEIEILWRKMEHRIDAPQQQSRHPYDDTTEQSSFEKEMNDYIQFFDDQDLDLQYFWPAYGRKFPKLYCVARKIFGIHGNFV